MARRLSLAFLIVFVDSIVMQILVSDCLSTLLLAYYLSVMPMVDRLSNFVQILNECVILVCTWLILQFTLYVPDAELRHQQANYFLYLALSNIIFNVLVLLFIILKRIYIAIKSRFTKMKSEKRLNSAIQDKSKINDCKERPEAPQNEELV